MQEKALSWQIEIPLITNRFIILSLSQSDGIFIARHKTPQWTLTQSDDES